MLKKLLKYDFKTLLQTMLPIYGIALILSIVSNIFLRINKLTPVFKIPASFITGLAVLVSIGMVFITLIMGMINFYKQTVKDEGYLLHTLPVTKDSIIISKLTSVTILSMLSVLVMGITLAITLNIDPSKIIEVIKKMLEFFKDYKLTGLLLLISVIIGQILNTLLMYLSISFGQKHPTNKLLYSIIYGVVTYNVTQILTMLIYLPFLSNGKFIEALEQDLPPAGIINTMLGVTIGLSLITSIIYYIFTKKNLENKLNLE